MRLLAALCALFCLVGCTGARVSQHPTVILDGAFTPEETEGALAGMTQWKAATPDVGFDVKSAPHAEILRLVADDAIANVIYFVRAGGGEDPECTTKRNGALTKTRGRLGVLVCVDAGSLEGFMPPAIAHELGHSWQLQHIANEFDSIMAPQMEPYAVVQCEDVQRLPFTARCTPPVSLQMASAGPIAVELDKETGDVGATETY